MTACSTVTAIRKKETRVDDPSRYPPSYQETKSFFFFGLLGVQTELDASRICLGKEIDQVSTAYTPGNVLVTALTLGIYAPRTVRVWCQLL